MDDKNMKTDITEETRAIRGAAEIAQKYKLLFRSMIALVIAFMVMAGCFVWALVTIKEVANNAQNIANKAMIEALNTVAEIGVTQETTTTTTTQTVDGDSATINNVEGEQYNDNAQNGGVE